MHYAITVWQMPCGWPIGESEDKWILAYNIFSSTLRGLDPLLRIWMNLWHGLDGEYFSLKEEVYSRSYVPGEG